MSWLRLLAFEFSHFPCVHVSYIYEPIQVYLFMRLGTLKIFFGYCYHFVTDKMAETNPSDVIKEEKSEEGEEELLARHRKEKKDIQGASDFFIRHICQRILIYTFPSIFIHVAQIQALKKTATKGDKKKKKDVGEEIAKLESEIETKHASELKKFQVFIQR